MRKVREILRLRFERGLSQRQISASTGVSKGALGEYLRRAAAAGLTWEVARALDDGEVEVRLFRYPGRNEPPRRVPIDMLWVHRELRRTGVTLQQLWFEYREAAAQSLPSGGTPYSYSQFCDLYAHFRERTDLSMRQVHRAGEKVFIDYSGKKPRTWSPETGEAVEVELFVAVLGASNYTFAEATRTQRLEDFCASTVRALEFFGGVPQIAVPDQLRSAISGPDRYDPVINPTYAELSQHYDMAIVPARPAKPRDKAKVEAAVLLAQRWILACLRNRTFFSLDDLNVAIANLLERLNTRPFKKLEGCRLSAFEALDRPALRPLPQARWELARWKKSKVNIDYHVEYDNRLYSVPHALVGERVELRVTNSVVEVFPPQPTRRQPPAAVGPQGLGQHHPGAPPAVPSRVRRLASVADHWVGRVGGAVGGGVGRADPPGTTRARERLPVVHGAHPQRQGLRPRPLRCRLSARHRDRRPHPQERARDPEPWPRRQRARGRGRHPSSLSPSATRTCAAATTTTERRQSPHDRRRDHPQKLIDLKLATMAQAFRDLIAEPPGNQRSFTEKIAVMVDREWTDRDNRRLARLLRAAHLTINDASLENVWCEPGRGLDKAVVRDLATCQWIRKKHNVIVIGKTGVGKSYFGAALAQAACRKGLRAMCARVPRLAHELAIARADGTYTAMLARLAKLDVLVLDDFLIAPLKDTERRDLLEVLEDRYGTSSTVVTTQVPTKTWHEMLADPTIADAICDRLVHNAHVIALKGPSGREKKGLQIESPQPTA